MNLSDHFGKFTCKTLKSNLGITTIEEALKYSDKDLMRCKGIGPMFCYRLRMINTQSEYERGFNDALKEAAKVITDNYQKCITQRQIDILNIKPKL